METYGLVEDVVVHNDFEMDEVFSLIVLFDHETIDLELCWFTSDM